jgi:crossover junction endodeoxyribonuclease RuvC
LPNTPAEARPSPRSTLPAGEGGPRPSSESVADLVLGIDPGLIVCGWGLVGAGPSPRYAGCGAIRPRPKDSIGKRLLHLHDAIAALIAEHAPTEVAIEEQFVGALDPRSALAIGQARAAAVLAAARAGLDVSFYSPAAVKSAVSGYGQSDKRQVQAMVRMLLRLDADPQPADAADALAIALTHLANRKMARLVSGR